jgi:beta-glucosidase-like glycosyl hydrolase/CubicO group peptidase (beta-lactamase class C family)
MIKTHFLLPGIFIFLFGIDFTSSAQTPQQKAKSWADSVLSTLNKDQRIAQLMIVRAHSNLGAEHINQVTNQIKKYNVGGLCFFQGGPVRQANLTNYYQSIAKTPLMITIDGEWGLGMRLDSVISLPRQLMLGAAPNAQLAYEYGKLIAQQCKRIGIQVNFAPVVDVNNNPNNPVINDRSFGEDKYKVALFGVQVMKGMQDNGVMACAKHFPGHGDTETDSHLDLPIINKTKSQLDSLELYPFRALFSNGVGSVMIGHLYIPAIDKTKNVATSLSYKNVTLLLRQELQYNGLTFTDALEMQGVRKFFPDGEASVQSILAGNDILCLPSDIPSAISKIKDAVRKKKLTWEDIDSRVTRVLMAKYLYGLGNLQTIRIEGLVNDLNENTNHLNELISEHAITLLKNDEQALPLNPSALAFINKVRKEKNKIAYLAIGITADNAITKKMKSEFQADVYYFGYKDNAGRIASLVEKLKNDYQQVLIGLHNYSRRPANNFGISSVAIHLANSVLNTPKTSIILFGNPYAAKNFCNAKNIMVSYEDNEVVQNKVYHIITGKIKPQGKLPVTVCENFKYGSGLSYPNAPAVYLEKKIIDESKFVSVDSIIHDAIGRRAFPGCVVMAVKDGAVVFEKPYGYYDYEQTQPMILESVFDMASVTKICATNISIMKLYEEGKVDLKKNLGAYLPWVIGTNKEPLIIEDILLHQAGLKSWIPFYKEIIDTQTGIPQDDKFESVIDDEHTIRVADELFMRNDWVDTMYQRILQSPLGPKGKYVYSDNDFIFLGKIVEQITGMSLDEYARKTFYEPLDLHYTGFRPRKFLPLQIVVPTEREVVFRRQQLRGDVHDPGAAMFGGVAGHAGLFSTAYEMAVLMQMLCNGGTIGEYKFFKKETVDLFTSYGSENSRRGLGFDKPERLVTTQYMGKDTLMRKDNYPSALSSEKTFGHTGYTGTCAWADPQNNIVYILLTNRVYPDGGANSKLLMLNVRGKVQDELYRVLLNENFEL